MSVSSKTLAASLLAFSLAGAPTDASAQRGRGTPSTPADSTVPRNLRSLLAPRHSEMRLVIQRYSGDHTLLGGNYATAQPGQGGRGGGRGGRGGGPPAADSASPISNGSISRGRRRSIVSIRRSYPSRRVKISTR